MCIRILFHSIFILWHIQFFLLVQDSFLHLRQNNVETTVSYHLNETSYIFHSPFLWERGGGGDEIFKNLSKGRDWLWKISKENQRGWANTKGNNEIFLLLLSNSYNIKTDTVFIV